MFRPQDMRLYTSPPDESLLAVPANVAAKSNLGWTVKYTLRFDDDVVSYELKERRAPAATVAGSQWAIPGVQGKREARAEGAAAARQEHGSNPHSCVRSLSVAKRCASC